jgi:hypothetical protein
MTQDQETIATRIAMIKSSGVRQARLTMLDNLSIGQAVLNVLSAGQATLNELSTGQAVRNMPSAEQAMLNKLGMGRLPLCQRPSSPHLHVWDKGGK